MVDEACVYLPSSWLYPSHIPVCMVFKELPDFHGRINTSPLVDRQVHGEATVACSEFDDGHASFCDDEE